MNQEQLMAKGLIEGLVRERAALKDALEHVLGELSMFECCEPDSEFPNCEDCRKARALMLHAREQRERAV